MIRVCSGWSPQGREIYGDRFLRCFDKFWAPEIELRVWVEEPHPMPRQACQILWDIPGAREFMDRWGSDPEARGLKQAAGTRWKRGATEAGYNFKFDAVKFFKQILIPQQASLDMADGDILIWLDGDVRTTAPVSTGFVHAMIGDHHLCYLGRRRSHPEIGFWAVRLCPDTRHFLWVIANIYTSGAFRTEHSEWHSAYIWEWARQALLAHDSKNLTPGGEGHVWLRSPLQDVMTHDKGKRKPGGVRG